MQRSDGMCVCVRVCVCVCVFVLAVFSRRFACRSECFFLTLWCLYFYHSAISKHVVRARIVVEMGSYPTKRFLFNHTTFFSKKGLEKSLCDFTRTVFVQCENPVVSERASV